jgi:hypothetical protein
VPPEFSPEETDQGKYQYCTFNLDLVIRVVEGKHYEIDNVISNHT